MIQHGGNLKSTFWPKHFVYGRGVAQKIKARACYDRGYEGIPFFG